MDKVKLMVRFFDTIRKVHKVAGLESARVNSGAITPLQVDALLHISKHSKLTTGELGKYLQLSSSSTTQLINRLEESGLVVRENSQNDRRLTIVSATNKGKDIFRKTNDLRMNKLKTIISLMPEKDIKELIRIFSNALENIEAHKKTK